MGRTKWRVKYCIPKYKTDDLVKAFTRKEWMVERLSRCPGTYPVRRNWNHLYAARHTLAELYQLHPGDIKDVYKRVMASKEHRNDRQLKFLDMLERRMDTFLYKVGIFETIGEARKEIKRSGVSINGIIKRKYQYMLNDDDYISFNFNDTSFTAESVRDRIRKRIESYTDYEKNWKAQVAVARATDRRETLARRAVETGQTIEAAGLESETTNEKEKFPLDEFPDYRFRPFMHRPPAHIPRTHFDFNYSTLTIHYRRSITGVHDMLDFGNYTGTHVDLERVLQYYWFSYICKTTVPVKKPSWQP
eukprot:130909_1